MSYSCWTKWEKPLKRSEKHKLRKAKKRGW